jgi:hypothetical protein
LRGLAVHFRFALAALAFCHAALPIAILHSSVATGAVAGTSGRGASGSAEVFGVGSAEVFRVGSVEVFGVGCTMAVGIVVSEVGEDLFATASSSS